MLAARRRGQVRPRRRAPARGDGARGRSGLPERRPARAGGRGAGAHPGAARSRARARPQRDAGHDRRGAHARSRRARAVRSLLALAVRERRQRALRRCRPRSAFCRRRALRARRLARVGAAARARRDGDLARQRARSAARLAVSARGALGRRARAAARRSWSARSACCGSAVRPSRRPSSRCSRAWRCRPRSRSTPSASRASWRRASWPPSTRSCARSRRRTCTRRATRSRSPSSRAASAACSGWTRAALRDVEHAAVLHDIGKIGIPSELLRKRGPLSAGEREHMRAHPEIGARILEPVERLRQLAPLVRFSHECWDGSGYPDGLAGEEIPLGARIISVCDAFDAMVSDRPYRGGRSSRGRARRAAQPRRHPVRPGGRRGVRASGARITARRRAWRSVAACGSPGCSNQGAVDARGVNAPAGRAW